EVVGEGGYGIVYRGTHLGFDETVAVKCLKVPAALSDAERESFLKDFRAEARLLHRLSRKTAGIVQALDVGAATSPRGVWTPYIAMEWLEGKNLALDIADRAAHGQARRPLHEAVALLTPIAEALAVTHAERVAHLDLKPANIFLGGDASVKLLDFGIAKVITTSETMTVAFTRTGARPAFTPAYAAPEQFDRRHGATGPWSDVYALALILIEVCSGEAALIGDTPVELYIAAANEQYRPSLASHGVRTSAEVDAVVKRALSVDPRQRYADAGSMWSALRGAMGSPALSATATAEPPPLRRATVGSSELNRVCTILFAELTGLEGSERLDPEQLSELVRRYMAALENAVVSLEGNVEQMVGESMMAVFGLYGESAGAAERAVHAALRMKSAIKSVTVPRRLSKDLPLTVSVGLATGRVFASARQSTAGFQLLATGAPVKLAARLQQSAPPGAVLVDRDTYRQVAGLFEMELRLGEHTPPTGTKAYLVKGHARDRHALHATAVRDFCGLDTRLAGRTAEMESLAAVQDSVTSESRPRVVTLLGAPGVGRSRVLLELADRLEQGEWVVLAGSASALGMRTSYALAASLLRARFHIHEDDSAEVAATKLRRGVRLMRGSDLALGGLFAALEGPIDIDETVDQLLRLLGAVSGDDTHLSIEAEGAAPKLRIAGALASLLRLSPKPVAILCDDLHWADEASLALLEDLCTRLGDRPLWIVAAARSELLERRPSWGEEESLHVRVDIRALPRRALEEMVRDRLRKVELLPDELVKRLVDHAEGNPLTLVETLHLLIDANVIDDRWQAHLDRLGELTLPTTVHGIVQARLDRLDEQTRMLLARAAIVGRAFWDGVLLELEGAPQPAQVRRSLAELRDRGILQARSSSTFPDEQEYVFCDSATQRVASEMLGHKERQRLHGVVARWLEKRIPSDARAARVAEHYERAAAVSEALVAYRRAGAHAAALGQNADALHAYERACAIDAWLNGEAGELFPLWAEVDDAKPLHWTESVALHAELGSVSRRMGKFDLAEQRYQDARTRIVADEDEALRWHARLDYRLAVVEKLRGRIDEGIALLEKALDHATLAEERAEMFALCASLMRRRNRLEECRSTCLRGLRACRETADRGDRWREALSKILNTLGSLLFTQKKMVGAERCYLQAARAVDERHTPGQASEALNNVAAVRYARGDLAGARECFQRVIRLTERSGDLWMRVTALANLGEVELAAARAEIAKTCLAEAARLGEQIRAHLDLPEVYRNLAQAELRLDERDKALAAAGRALELVRASKNRLYLESVLTAVAEVCAAVGRARADRLTRELMQTLEGIDGIEATAARCRALLADVDR
ncbi:MAG TPA: AAA family ATPase, partial [Polyangiaceae bacterium]|nr:AAA family ATPase [Polyangiaceae bacterium]